MIEYTSAYEEEVKDLLVELQEYLAMLDSRGVIVLKGNYREDYFKHVMSKVDKHNGKIFLAEKANKIVGLVVCKIFQGGGELELTTSCPKIGFISDLIVTKDERGNGFGEELLMEAERYFAENGCEYIQLEVFAPNVSAFDIYRMYGYNVNTYYMSKKLRNDKKSST